MSECRGWNHFWGDFFGIFWIPTVIVWDVSGLREYICFEQLSVLTIIFVWSEGQELHLVVFVVLVVLVVGKFVVAICFRSRADCPRMPRTWFYAASLQDLGSMIINSRPSAISFGISVLDQARIVLNKTLMIADCLLHFSWTLSRRIGSLATSIDRNFKQSSEFFSHSSCH
jgi:hypothetical protein